MPSWPSLRSVRSVMTVDPLVLMTDVDQATEALLRTAEALDDGAVAAPSLLPGWTRGHVLTHLARQADAITNLLTWARTGVDTPGGPPAVRELTGLTVTKASLGPMDNNAYLLRCRTDGTQVLIDAANDAARL